MTRYQRRFSLAGLLFLIGVLAMVVVTACGGGDEDATAVPTRPSGASPTVPATAAPAATPTTPAPAGPEGQVTVAIEAVGSPIFYPEALVFPTSFRQVQWGILESLWTWGVNDAGEETLAMPSLVESWEVSSDNTEVTIRLRQGINFRTADRDWGEMTADDVVWTINNAGPGNPNSRHDRAAELTDTFEEWEKVDDHTVRAPFNTFRNDFIDAMMSDVTGIHSKQIFDELGEEEMLDTPHGTGAFVVEDWLPNERIEMTSVADHWRHSPQFAELLLVEVPEASVRAAMLRTGEANVAPVSTADLTKLQEEGVEFHEGLRQFRGLWTWFSGNFWMTEEPETGEAVEREIKDKPWIGNPFEGGGDFDQDSASMVRARKVREAMALAIDRQLISETILGGFGSPNYLNFHESHPEWQEKYRISHDPDRARELLVETGYPDGFEVTLWCPLDVGNDQEVCEAVAGMWEEELNVDVSVDVTVYTANRPQLVGRTWTDPWVQPWGSNRNDARTEAGGTAPGCCLWPRPGFSFSMELPMAWESFQTTSAQERGSAENLASREEYFDFMAREFLSVGISEFPSLVGIGGVANWDLRPLGTLNSFDTIVLAD